MIANLVGQTLRLHKLIARDRDRLMQEKARLQKSDPVTHDEGTSETIKGIVGNSPAIRAVIDKIRIVAKSKSTVLLRGESGTGKELFAAAIHNFSPRHNKPFVKLNCAALSESVLESELFGHERGAFTGAMNLHKGRFELADGGTLFLDEIGEIAAPFQAKLLRVLQEGEFERVGGTRTLKTDVRLVCATNRNLEEAVQRGEFRADLYYRISVVPVFLPPLRERQDDLKLLAKEFLRRFNAERGSALTFSESAINILTECGFPGNIRELENCVFRTATLARSDSIIDRDFSCQNDGCLSAMLWSGSHTTPNFTALPIVNQRTADVAKTSPSATEAVAPAAEPDMTPAACPVAKNCTLVETDQRTDREKIIDAMKQAGWVKAKAARLLGLSPRQIGYALQKHNIPIKKF